MYGLIAHILAQEKDNRMKTIMKLHKQDVWAIFNALKKYYLSTNQRYVYMAAPDSDKVSMNIYMNAAHADGIFLTSFNRLKIDVLPYAFGSKVLGSRISLTMMRLWQTFDMLADGVEHNMLSVIRFVSWEASNIRMIKIDTHSRKLYTSELFSLKSAVNCADISSYFIDVANHGVIYDIVFSLLT